MRIFKKKITRDSAEDLARSNRAKRQMDKLTIKGYDQLANELETVDIERLKAAVKFTYERSVDFNRFSERYNGEKDIAIESSFVKTFGSMTEAVRIYNTRKTGVATDKLEAAVVFLFGTDHIIISGSGEKGDCTLDEFKQLLDAMRNIMCMAQMNENKGE